MQLEALRSYATQRGWMITAEIRDVGSIDQLSNPAGGLKERWLGGTRAESHSFAAEP
jgi:hypothetical protein